jgi:hypothetical protein
MSETRPLLTVVTRRHLAVFVAVMALAGFFLYYNIYNDHYDRLARARQIAVYGDVPFRDFFDPGYFLTLYTSALMQRVLGDNLLGEMLLNLAAMTAGATLVFLLASSASGSSFWGLIAAGMTVMAEPRTYDYDKVFFYPLGLWACWRYIERPALRTLMSLAGITVLAGLFRYDSAVYIGGAALVAVAAMHFDDWRLAAGRLATLALAMLLFASPALLFIHATAGLGDAFTQIVTYAKREGARSSIFVLTPFQFDWATVSASRRHEVELWGNAKWLPTIFRPENAQAWLHRFALVVPVAAVLLVPLRRSNRDRRTIARLLSSGTLVGLAALFVLREPVHARIGGVLPVVLIAAGLLVGEWRAGMRVPVSTPTRKAARQVGLLVVAAVPFFLTLASLWGLLAYPPFKNIEVARRLSEFATVPPDIDLMPKGAMEPVAEYIRACTRPTDRFFEPWFAGELYFFSGRGFAAGLPVVFGDHWSELPFQRRALRILEQQNVPIIVREDGDLEKQYRFIWTYVLEHYELARTTRLGLYPALQIWVRQGQPVTRLYGKLGLPCYAP